MKNMLQSKNFAIVFTFWENEESLEAFAGENWNQAVIPPEMEKYPRAFTVAHYKNDDMTKNQLHRFRAVYRMET